jgi:outer membrane protein assembly factor BamA
LLPWAAEAETTFLPVPEVVVSPTEGQTVGVLGVLLVTDEQQQIRRIIAPDVRYNEIFGIYPTFRIFDYPSNGQKIFLSGGKSTKIDEYFEASYAGLSRFGGLLDVDLRLVRDLDSRERFFGIGNDTDEDDETNYTGDVYWGHLNLGVHLPDDLSLLTGARVRWVRIRRGGVDDLPFTGDEFTSDEAPGLDGETLVGQRFGFSYDTRDSPDIPSRGSFFSASMEVVDKAIGSTLSYLRFSFDGRAFRSLSHLRPIVLGVRAFADYMDGGERAPFYELSSLGGTRSLRGFGTHRFRDRHRVGAQAEVRATVYEREIFNVQAALEATPFFDIGKVFADSREFPLEDLHPVGGVGFRAVVRPQVVAFVDVGVGEEGVATFTGIEYPF